MESAELSGAAADAGLRAGYFRVAECVCGIAVWYNHARPRMGTTPLGRAQAVRGKGGQI